MLIAPGGLTNKRKLVTLENRHAQVLIDAEPFLANLGLGFELRCGPCRRAGKNALVVGGYDPKTSTFSMTCDCSERRYVGNDIVWPKAPTWSPLPKDRIFIQRQVPLNNWHVSRFNDLDRVLSLLKLQYALNCLQCMNDGNPTVVAGSRELELTIECQCAKRTYKPHDASATVH